MTSIEWLEKKFKTYLSWSSFLEEDFEQAKEMHKKEIIDAWNSGLDNFLATNNSDIMVAEHYYQETFGSKGSDNLTKEIINFMKKEKERKEQLPQQELSDEEIEKGAREWYDKEDAYKLSAIALKTWVYAIRWYREQLKQKL
jgi:formyltetrahydrofolate synthetase